MKTNIQKHLISVSDRTEAASFAHRCFYGTSNAVFLLAATVLVLSLLTTTAVDARPHAPRYVAGPHFHGFAPWRTRRPLVVAPYRRVYRAPPARVVVVNPATGQSRDDGGIYAYPVNNQSPERQRQDRYECHVWAVDQTGFDPSTAVASAQAPTHIVYAEPRAPGLLDNPVTGAAGGAALGAAGGAIAGDAGTGAAVGAAVGAIAGLIGAAEQANREPVSIPVITQPAATAPAEYRRAITACLAGRGYEVR